jgi:hypothetical protein
MAKKAQPATEPHVHESAMDYAEHEKSYSVFTNLIKWSAISIAVVLVILYFVVLA